jgi:hypothetical protein
MSTTAYIIKGCNNEEHICARCGRTELNRVIWLAPLDSDGNEIAEASPYGTTCAARLMAPKAERRTAEQLVRIAKAVAYITRWNTGEYPLHRIADAVGVKYNVWASAEGSVIKVNTPTGWVQVTA